MKNESGKREEALLSFRMVRFLFLIIMLMAPTAIVAQSAGQEPANQSTEHFSVVLTLNPSGEITIDDLFQQNNLLAIAYGNHKQLNSNLLVFDLDSHKRIYEISEPGLHDLVHPYLLGNKLLYQKIAHPGYQTICIDLFAEEPKNFTFQGVFAQVTDDGHLLVWHYDDDIRKYINQVIDLQTGAVLFEPDISAGGEDETLCIEDTIIFPFCDGQKDPAGYRAMSTSGEDIFILPTVYGESYFEIPDCRSKISSFPLPVIRKQKDALRDEWRWFLEYVDRQGEVIASHELEELNLNNSNIEDIDCFSVVDESQFGYLLRFRYHCLEEAGGSKWCYVFTGLSGNIIKIFDEQDDCDIGFDPQGNILLLPNSGPFSGILQCYRQDGTLLLNAPIPCVFAGSNFAEREFRFTSDNEVLGWEGNRFSKYSLVTGQLTGIYSISYSYYIDASKTIIYNDQVYFFAQPRIARPRRGHEPKISGSNYCAFSAAEPGWLDVELVSIKPNAGSSYELWDNTEVKVMFETEYGYDFEKNLTVAFEKGEVLSVNQNDLQYTWKTPTVISGSQENARITVSYGPVSREFIVTVKDPPPIASFAYQPASPQTDQDISFNASKSSDVDGSIVSYQWDFGDGTSVQEQQQSIIKYHFAKAGEYQVTLTITDNNGQTASIAKSIRVSKAPEAPVADFKVLAPSSQWDTKVRFDASLSKDADGSIVSYNWDFGDGTTGEGITVDHEYFSVGAIINDRQVTLTVKDNQNLTATKKIPIVVGYILTYENKGRIGIPAALRDKDNRKVDYKIEITTGNVKDAGTDSFVYVALFGPETERGRYGSGEFELYDVRYPNRPFEQGQTDYFTKQGYYLDEVEFMTLRHSNQYDKPGWYAQSVKVKNTSNGKEWLFVPDQWLAMNEPPENQTWGIFYPVQQYSILYKWKDRSLGMIEASDHIFILPKDAETFYFKVLDRDFNLAVYRQEFLPNGTVSNTFVGNQFFTGNGPGLSYSSGNITKPTRFMVKIKEGNTLKEELYTWVFPSNWKDNKNEARKVTLLYPLKGSTEIFLQGQQFKNYLTGLQVNVNNVSAPIIKYGADSLKIFGSVPDEKLFSYIEIPVKKYTEQKAVKVLATMTGKTFNKITDEIVSIYKSLYKAAKWGSQLDGVIAYSTGEVYKIDFLKYIGDNDVNFLQSLELLEKIKEKIDGLITSVDSNNLQSCINYLNDIKKFAVGNNPGSENKDDHIIDYPSGQTNRYPLYLVLATELYNIQSWRDYHHGYLDSYLGGTMSTWLEGLIGLSEEDKKDITNEAMDVYEPIIKKLMDLSSILISASLLTDQSF